LRPASTTEELYDQLSRVGRTAVECGLVLASGGNLSARLPGADSFVVTGAGTWLDDLCPTDFSTVACDDGRILGGTPRPSSEWKLHWRTYQRRPDVNAIVHLHPQHAVLLDALNEEIRLVTLDHAYYLRSIGHVPYHPNGSDELADLSAEQAEKHNAMILAHHGCSALGEDVSMAFRRAANLEEAATATYRLLALGNQTLRFPGEHFAALHHT